MKKALWQRMLFICAAFVFFCLLLSGGSRLIAAPDEPADCAFPISSQMRAALTCPPCVREMSGLNIGVQENRPAFVMPTGLSADNAHPDSPQTDANGNILRHASYMRAVYQAFALGDGFA